MEVYIPNNNKNCELPKLHGSRYCHTSDGKIICGGQGKKNAATTCITMQNDGHWKPSHTLADDRYCHTSWYTNEKDIILMGGMEERKNAVSIKGNELKFNMDYDTV